MSRIVGIVQSNYVPWKGYFDLINFVDEFILFDDAQFTRRDWRNRNQIKTPDGPDWLSIAVSSKGRYFDPIKSITVSQADWNVRHWKTIVASYVRAPHFKTYEERFKELYLGCGETRLSAINHRFLVAICDILDIRTKISWSMDYEMIDGKTERLVHFCRQANASAYVSGPSAQGYIETGLFRDAGMRLLWADYSAYREYRQLFPPFTHQVSILDLLFNEGPEATRFMLTFGADRERFVRETLPGSGVGGPVAG